MFYGVRIQRKLFEECMKEIGYISKFGDIYENLDEDNPSILFNFCSVSCDLLDNDKIVIGVLIGCVYGHESDFGPLDPNLVTNITNASSNYNSRLQQVQTQLRELMTDDPQLWSVADASMYSS